MRPRIIYRIIRDAIERELCGQHGALLPIHLEELKRLASGTWIDHNGNPKPVDWRTRWLVVDMLTRLAAPEIGGGRPGRMRIPR